MNCTKSAMSLQEVLETLKFGSKCKRVRISAKKNIQLSREQIKIELERLQTENEVLRVTQFIYLQPRTQKSKKMVTNPKNHVQYFVPHVYKSFKNYFRSILYAWTNFI